MPIALRGENIPAHLHMSVNLAEWLSVAGGWKIAAVTFGSIIALRLAVAPYWLWKAEHERASHLASILAERLDLRFDPLDSECNITPCQPNEFKLFRVKVCALQDAGSVDGCLVWLVSVVAPNARVPRDELPLFIAPRKIYEIGPVTIQGGQIKHADVIYIGNDNVVRVGTPAWPDDVDTFARPGTYLLEVKVTSNRAASVSRRLSFKWTGDWRTAEMAPYVD